MFNLDGMIDPLIQRFTPHFETASRRLSHFEKRLLARLDLILMQMNEDDFELSDPRMRITINLVDGELDLCEVPSNEEWLLESVSYQTTAPSFLIVRNGDRLIFNQALVFGRGPIILGGSILTVEAEATGEAYFQFRRRMPNERIKNMAAGMVEVDEPGGMPRTQLNQDAQHTGYQQHHTLTKV